MALVKVDYFSRVLGMDVTCDVILPQKASRLIGMETAERSGGTPSSGSCTARPTTRPSGRDAPPSSGTPRPSVLPW